MKFEMIQRLTTSESWFFVKFNKIDKFFEDFTKEKKEQKYIKLGMRERWVESAWMVCLSRVGAGWWEFNGMPYVRALSSGPGTK